MNKIKNISLFGATLALFVVSGCATPQMRRWEGKKFTLCCQQHACSTEEWHSAPAKFCSGSSKQIGGEITDRVTGYQINSTGSRTGNNSSGQETMTANRQYEDCRTYECSGEITQ